MEHTPYEAPAVRREGTVHELTETGHVEYLASTSGERPTFSLQDLGRL